MFQARGEGIAGAGDGIGHPAFRIRMRGPDDGERKFRFLPPLEQPSFTSEFFLGVIPKGVAQRSGFGDWQGWWRFGINGGRADEEVLPDDSIEQVVVKLD